MSSDELTEFVSHETDCDRRSKQLEYVILAFSVMLKLNKSAERILRQFIEIGHPLEGDNKENYKQIAGAYNRIIRVFLYINQDVLDVLSEENLDNINSAVSRIYESLFWVRVAVSGKDDPKFQNVEWLLISDKKDGLLTEVYRLAIRRLVKLPRNKFLYNAFFRLLNSYHIASTVTEISSSIIASRSRQAANNNSDLIKSKRSGKSFVLRVDPVNRKVDKVLPTEGLDRRILDASKGMEFYFD